MSKNNVEDVFAKAAALAKTFAQNSTGFLELGALLRFLNETEPDRFRDLVKQSQIGLRKAYYLIGIDKVFGHAKVPKARLEELGWTKLSVIQKVVEDEPSRLNELLEFAANHSTADLKRYLKGDAPEGNSHVVLMYFSPQEYADLADTLEEFGATKAGRGLVDKEKALMRLLEHHRGRMH